MKYFLTFLLGFSFLLGACSSPKDKEFLKATELVKQNKLESALKLYNEILRKDPNYISAIINRALVYDKLGEEKLARNDYDKALKLTPNQVDLLNNVGVFYLEKNRPQLAKYYFTRALSVQGGYTPAYVNRAKANQMLGYYKQAVADMEIALGLEPQNIDIVLNKAILDHKNFDLEQALDGYSEVLNSRPQDYKTYNRRALAFRALNTYQNALNDFNNALSINGSYIPALFNRAELFFDQGNYEAALSDLNVIKSIDNKYVPAYDFSGDIYAIEDPVKAASNYLIAKDLDPINAEHYDAKIKLMLTEEGRQAVINKRLERI